MDRQHKLSNVTKEYIEEYSCILDKMIMGMTSAELGESISCNFINQMIPHHRGAIEMSENILKYTTDITLQSIAENIIVSQKESIKNMDKIKCCCCETKNCSRDVWIYQNRTNQIMNVMFEKMGNAPVTNNINCDFIWEMIPHHMGAVEMSENTLRFDICKGLVPILDEIIKSQKKGIMEMHRLANVLGCRCGQCM